MNDPLGGSRWAWAKRPATVPQSAAMAMDQAASEPERPPSERRVNEATRGAFSIGSPISATFIGLLMAQAFAAETAEAAPDVSGTTGPETDGSEPLALPDQANGSLLLDEATSLQASVPTSSVSDGFGDLTGTLTQADAQVTREDPVVLAAVENTEPDDASAPLGEENSVEINLGVLQEDTLPEIDLDAAPPVGDVGGPIGEFLVGTDEADILEGTDANDSLEGRGGDDVLRGGAGDDDLLGGAGNDELYGGDGLDELFGGDGDDILAGELGNDRLVGEAGDDILNAGIGNDELRGGAGNDRLVGGPGEDRMIGGTGSDTYVVDHPFDTVIESNNGLDRGGQDTVEISAAYDQNSTDPATFVVGTDEVPDDSLLNASRDFLGRHIEHARLEGDRSHDLVGSEDNNELFGNAGDNRIHGQGGDDTLMGAAGSDFLFGGEGNDLLDGGAGEDFLYGGAGDDTFMLGLSENDADTIFDHEGANTLKINGANTDKIVVRNEEGTLVLRHEDEIIGRVDGWGDNKDSIAGIEFDDGMRPLTDFLENDTVPDEMPLVPDLVGTAGDDTLAGGDADEWLSGGAGSDILEGGAGNDRLEGGDGSDTLRGGPGDDTYVFRASDRGVDRLSDSQGSSTIEVQEFALEQLSGLSVGDDFWLFGGQQPFAVIEDYAGNETNWAELKVDDQEAGDKVFG